MLVLYYKLPEVQILKITSYDSICNLGIGMDNIYNNAIQGNSDCFTIMNDYIKPDFIRAGLIKCDLPQAKDKNYNTRCNALILKNLELLNLSLKNLLSKYDKSKIGVIAATTNSGVEEYETTQNYMHYELGNPAFFLHKHLGLTGYFATVSTACSSGIKAFSLSRDLMNTGIIDAAIIICVDPLAKVPVYGFHSLEVLSNNPSNPFSKNRAGMNIGEACAMFITEKEGDGIEVLGIGESSDIYHSTTPNPEGTEGINAINMALKDAGLNPDDIDYINAHGTGTAANDIMEANAIFNIFGNTVPVSSTKPLTGHCLGAAAGIETALCCKLLEKNEGKLYPHIYDGEYDASLPKIQLAEKNKTYKCNKIMCNAFGFGGTNAIMILGREGK